MNQNLLIVDDEIEILSWLEELFRFESGLEIDVYTAGSAAEALRQLSRTRFDVVLTDIRMPGMDGLTLFRHIKENWPRCKTVFLTGYGNFDDIYTIINHKDVQYLLKSEPDEVILHTVARALKQSRLELEQEQISAKHRQWLDRARHWLAQELMRQILSGHVEPDTANRMRELSMRLDPDQPALLFLLRNDSDGRTDLIQSHYLEEVLLRVLRENMPGKLQFYVYFLGDRIALLAVQPVESDTPDWGSVKALAQGSLELSQAHFKANSGASFSAVVSARPYALEEYQAAFHSLRQYMVSYIGGAREAILNMDTQESLPVPEELPAVQLLMLKKCLETHNKTEYFQVMSSALAWLARRKQPQDTKALELYYTLSIFLLQFINENHIEESINARMSTKPLTMASAHATWENAAQYLLQLSEAIFAQLDAVEDLLSDRALRRVVIYIDNHLDNDLSLTALAEVGGFNASYLSRLFKQVTGENLTTYILHRRMSLATDLLAHTNIKIQDIAQRAGYPSAHSFARAFRGEFGITPTEYRDTARID